MSGDHGSRRLLVDAAEFRPQVSLAQRHALELGKKIEVPPVTAEFAVGDAMKADGFLLCDDGADGVLLKRHVLLPARFGKPGGTQQTSHVVRTEWRLHDFHHGEALSRPWRPIPRPPGSIFRSRCAGRRRIRPRYWSSTRARAEPGARPRRARGARG